MTWLKETFGVEKPIVAMLHMQPMPGDPHYDSVAGVKAVAEHARRELAALQEGGVDSVMFSNEFSLPYLTKTEPITSITMARVIGELMDEIKVPHGVNVLWDGMRTIDLAAATDAKFVREIFTGVYASDFGLWNTDVGAVARHRRHVDAQNVKMIYNIVPEAAVYVGEREIESIAKTTVFNCRPDILAVSGATAGSATDPEILRRAKSAAGDTPVFANTGSRVDTIAMLLGIADGAVVGTAFKKDGKFENAADAARVTEFMTEVRRARGA